MLYLARRRVVVCACLFFLAALIVGLSIFRLGRQQSDLEVISRALLDKVIILDPGHGGIDPGAVSREGLYEKDVVLAIAFDLRDLLSRAGANVIMTRQSDRSLSDLPPEARVRAHKQADLKKRVEIAQEHEADLFISIHGNGSPSSRWSGAQTFYFPGNSPSNRPLAVFIQQSIINLVGRTNRQVQKIEHQYILKHLTIPSVNVEIGFLTNSEEARLLATEEYQQKMAWAIFVGIVKFLAAEEAGDLGH
jgi:N-acetylmuramoyl-L-alanine amidase